MVNEKVLVRDKHRTAKKIIRVLLIIFSVLLVLLIAFAAGFLIKKPKIEIILENPLAGIVLKYTNELGIVDRGAVIDEGILEFNENYINYILVALGTGYLHKSILLENPFIEFDLEGEIWNSEIKKGVPKSKRGEIENEDIIVRISKEEAVKALIAEDIIQFMKDSFNEGNTKIEAVAGKAELFSKGYLDMYEALTGEKASI